MPGATELDRNNHSRPLREWDRLQPRSTVKKWNGTDLDRGADFSPRLRHILKPRGLKSAPLFARVIPQAPNTARLHFHLMGEAAKS